MYTTKIKLTALFLLFFTFVNSQVDSILINRKAYFTAGLGLIKTNDLVLQNELNKSVVKQFHSDLMFGNLKNRSIHFISGLSVSFAGSGADPVMDAANLGPFTAKTTSVFFQTDLGFRGYLNKSDLAKNPLFFQMSWVHGVNNNKDLHYKNEYNAVNFGIGMTKPFNDAQNSYFLSLNYIATRQNATSLDKFGRMNLDMFSLALGLTL